MTKRADRVVPVKMANYQVRALRAAVMLAAMPAPGRFQHFKTEAERREHLRQVEEAQKSGAAPF